MAERASEWEGDPNLGAMRREEAQPWEEEVVCIHMRVRCLSGGR